MILLTTAWALRVAGPQTPCVEGFFVQPAPEQTGVPLRIEPLFGVNACDFGIFLVQISDGTDVLWSEVLDRSTMQNNGELAFTTGPLLDLQPNHTYQLRIESDVNGPSYSTFTTGTDPVDDTDPNDVRFTLDEARRFNRPRRTIAQISRRSLLPMPLRLRGEQAQVVIAPFQLSAEAVLEGEEARDLCLVPAVHNLTGWVEGAEVCVRTTRERCSTVPASGMWLLFLPILAAFRRASARTA